MSSSTFPGSGTIGGSLQDNIGPSFVAQQKTLTKIMEMGLYGMPMGGSPLCGSVDDNTSK